MDSTVTKSDAEAKPDVPPVTGAWGPATRPFDLPARLPSGTRSFRTIESHTAGNPTRTVLSGVPELSGGQVEKRTRPRVNVIVTPTRQHDYRGRAR